MAAQDIFGYRRQPKPAGAFSTEDSVLTFGGVTDPQQPAANSSVGLLVQSWNVSYQQQLQEVFELGSNRLYWSKGRPTGTGTLLRAVGFKPASVQSEGGKQSRMFPPEAFDICKGGAMFKLTAKSGNCDYAEGSQREFTETYGIGITMDGVLVTQIGYSAQVADTRLMENIAWRFAQLDVRDAAFGNVAQFNPGT
jgi:hypothetical protein